MRRVAGLAKAVVLATGAGLSACGSSPTNYYTLLPSPGEMRRGGPAVVEVRRVALAGYLDRSDIVRDAGEYKLRVDELQRWGEPLGDMVGRVLTQDLTQRLPDVQVLSEGGAVTGEPGAVVEVDVRRFDRDPDGTVVLVADMAVGGRQGRPGVAPRVLTLRVPALPGEAAQAAAMSTALGEAADQVAATLTREPGV